MTTLCIALLLTVSACAQSAATPPTPTPPGPATRAPTAMQSGRIRLLAGANQSFTQGDVQAALAAYEQVLLTPASDESPALSSAVAGVAGFRTVVLWLRLKGEDEARESLDALQAQAPGSRAAALATQLYDQYGMTGDLPAACASVAADARAWLGEARSVLQPAGADIDPSVVCPG